MSKPQSSPALQLLVEQATCRSGIRERWKREESDLVTAHELAFSALASLISRHQGQATDQPSRAVEGQMCLAAQFVIGVEPCEVAISEGLYSQASALLKQELETIAAIDEFESGTRKEGKTPAVSRGRLTGFGSVYGKLNEISHVSRHGIARSLVYSEKGDLVGANIMPVYNREMARFLFGQHIHYINLVGIQVNELLKRVLGSGMTSEELGWWAAATRILMKEGLIEVDAKATGPEADWMRGLQGSSANEA